MFELLNYLFPCSKKILLFHSHAQVYTIHCNEPWSHAPITLLYPLVVPCLHLHFCSLSLLHSHELLLQLFHPYISHDSVHLLLMYTALFSRLPEIYNCTLPVKFFAHQKSIQPSIYTLKSITIAVQHLSDWLYTCTGTKQTQSACTCINMYTGS